MTWPYSDPFPLKMFLYAVVFWLACSAAAQYIVVPFNHSRPVGPDGPWYHITLGTGAPLQYVDFYPTLNASTNWLVASLNCNNASQFCPESSTGFYDSISWSGLRFHQEMDNKSAISFAGIYGSTAHLLGADTSFGYWHAESFNLAANDGHPASPYFAGGLSQITSNYTNVEFPNGRSYVPLSLFTLDPSELQLPIGSNTSDMGASLLTDLINDSSVTSASWSMHMGSYFQTIKGMLIFGGYDSTRLVGEPAAYSSSGLELSSISLATSQGGYNWTSSELEQNYLDSQAINVSMTPSLPYLYLPSSVCSRWPKTSLYPSTQTTTYYLWNVTSPSYTPIVTSPSYLNFTFNGPNNQPPLTINVPFALLNLTLQSPLVDQPTNYFPCSPSNTSFALSRAFLQSAFIAQNHNSSTLCLG